MNCALPTVDCVQAADSLERSTDREDEYMIVDTPLVNHLVSVPANLGALISRRYGGVVVDARC